MWYALHKCILQFMRNLNTQSWMTHLTQTGVLMVNPFLLKFARLHSMWGDSQRTLLVCGECPISNYFKAKITGFCVNRTIVAEWCMGRTCIISKGLTVRVKFIFLSRFSGPITIASPYITTVCFYPYPNGSLSNIKLPNNMTWATHRD